MLGFGDPKKRIQAVIDSMGKSEESDKSELLKEPVEMLLSAIKDESVEGVANMLSRIFNILKEKEE